MAITIGSSTLQSGTGSATYNGTSLTAIYYGSTPVWFKPNCSRTKCCSRFYNCFTGVQFGDDTVNDEIVLGMHRDYDPGVSMCYELCACVYVCAFYCYRTGPGTCASAYCTGTFCGSLGCKTIASGTNVYGCWDTSSHKVNVNAPSEIVTCSPGYGSSIKLKLINHTTNTESDWVSWSQSSENTAFYV